ncbi:MAG: DUF1800 domain-containing protein [Acidobacteria bacterium]|nr:DUF1800 domain-containing protein [Acidobacteriota bacterium]
MSIVPVFRIRVLALVCVSLFLAILAAWPFAAQQSPFDESRIVNDLTAGLQLTPEQAGTLTVMLQRQRPRIEGLLQQMSRYQPGSPQFDDFRSQLDREQRSILEDFLPALRPEQQAKLREVIENFGKPPVQGRSPIAPLRPNLPSGVFAASERLIPQPAHLTDENTRSRRATVPPPISQEQKILHLLNRAGFGPRPGDVERVRQMGIENYLDEQLHPEDLADEFLDRPLQALGTMQATLPELFQTYLPPPPRPMPTPTPTPVPEEKGAETMRPPDGETGKRAEMEMKKTGDQMMEKSAQEKPDSKIAPPRPQASTPVNSPAPQPKGALRPTPAVDTQRPLRELQQAKLLRAVFSERQLQEVMVDFWFNHFNVFAGKDNARLMLTVYERDAIRPHALGKFKELLIAVAQSPAMMVYLDNFLSQRELPPPPPKYDADGNLMPPPRRPGLNENYARELMELHTLGVDGGYTQKDVQEVARCLTGWTIGQQPNPMFIFRPRTHDKGEKIVLGKRIASGGGIEDGLRVLELLAKHPSTARFISFKLCQRFIADEPPQSAVDRAAQVFIQTDGDIRQVVRSILTSPEFYSPRYYRNKIKSPLELAASAIRAAGAATDAAAPLVQTIARMGEPLYQCQPPTGYSEDSSHWLSSATLLERMNFAVALIGNRINGTRVDLSRLVAPETTKDQKHLLDNLIAALVHSDVSKETRENLTRVLNEERAKMTPARFDARRNNELIGSVAALVLGSREFQVK